MAEIRRSGRFSLQLLVLCALLGYVVYIQANAKLPIPSEPAAAPRPTDGAGTPVAEPEFAMPPLEDFTETLARPLFMDTRRPPEPGEEPVAEEAPPPEPPKATAKLAGLELSGIVITSKARVALIRKVRAGELLRLSVGEQVDGWTIDAIRPDRVILRKNEIVEELVLKDKARQRRDRRRRDARPTAQTETRPAPRTVDPRPQSQPQRPNTAADPPAATPPRPE
jgi:general secretion pathway protein N